MKAFKRIMALMLAILMLATAVACGAKDDPNATTTAATTTAAQGYATSDGTTAATEVTYADPKDDPNNYDANGYWKDDLPDDLDYAGDEVSVLHWNSWGYDFVAEEITGNPISDSCYERNASIEDRLGVKLNFTECKGGAGEIDIFVQKVRTAHQAGAREFDIIPTYTRTAGVLASGGMLYNLNGIENGYINLEQPWWPDCITDTVTIGDEIYFITGDATISMLYMMYTVWFNKDLINQYQLDNPYDLVNNNTWTLEQLFRLTNEAYQDLNANNSEDSADFFGLVSTYYGLDAFYTGSDLRLVELHDTDYLIISPDYSSEKTITLVDMLGDRCSSTDWYIGTDDGVVFRDSRALFNLNRCNYAMGNLTGVNFSYGLVPVPKYDENQEDYVTVLGNPVSLFGIMSDIEADRLLEMTAVIECWASEGYRLTTPAVYEISMKTKYVEGEEEATMFDVMRNSIELDLGRVFSEDLQYMSEIPSKAANEDAAWTTRLAQYKRPLENGLKKIVSAFKSIQE